MGDRLLKFTLTMAVAAFFAVMWGLLLREHLFVGGTAAFQPNYESLLKPGQKERVERWGVYFVGHRIGQSDLKIDRDVAGMLHVRSETSITIDRAVRVVLGVPGNLEIRFEATISPLTGLHDFQVNSKGIETRLLGTVDGDTIHVNGQVAGRRLRTDLPYSPGVFLGEVFSPFSSLPELRPGDVGRTWTVDMVNPLAGGVQHVTVRIGATQQVELNGGRTRVYRLDFATGSSHWETWVSQDGDVLLQGTPFGLTLRRDDLPPPVVQQLQAATPTAPAPPQP